MEASEKQAKPDKLKVALLLNQIGNQALDIYNTFQYVEGESKDNYTDVISKFDAYCQPRKNVVYERFKFFSRSQEEGEPVDKYVTDLRKQAALCEFEDQVDSLIRDRLVLGLRDKQIQERLLRELNLKLQKELHSCRVNEISKQEMQEIKGGEVVVKIKSKARKPVATTAPNQEQVLKSKFKKKCSRCGYQHLRKQCPAHGKICGNCNKKTILHLNAEAEQFEVSKRQGMVRVKKSKKA